MEQARIDRGEVTGRDRGEYLSYKDHEIRYRQELMRKRVMEEEMEGCTFSPATNPSRNHMSRISVVQHSQLWNERRDEWRAQAQEQKLQQEMKECTFRPEIDITSRVQSRPSTPGNRPTTPGGSRAKGFDEFVLRQEAARQAREEARQVPHVAGKNWTRTPTKPQPFNFNHSEKVKALQPPGKPDVVEKTNKRGPQMFTEPPAIPMEYDEDGDPMTSIVEQAPDSRVETRLKRFLNKYSTSRSNVDLEEDDEEAAEGRQNGEQGFVKRMAEARRIRAEKEQALNQVTGRKWKATTTTPKSFHFNDPAAAVVRSLRPPVVPLRADWF
jgi:hypothetical protein